MLTGVLSARDNDDKCSNIMTSKNNNKMFSTSVKLECFSLPPTRKRPAVPLKNNNFDNELDLSKHFLACIH